MTRDQSRMLAYIRTYQRDHGGASPTLKEASGALGLSGIPAAHSMLRKLVHAGHIVKDGWRSYSFPAPKCCPNCGHDLGAA